MPRDRYDGCVSSLVQKLHSEPRVGRYCTVIPITGAASLQSCRHSTSLLVPSAPGSVTDEPTDDCWHVPLSQVINIAPWAARRCQEWHPLWTPSLIAPPLDRRKRRFWGNRERRNRAPLPCLRSPRDEDIRVLGHGIAGAPRLPSKNDCLDKSVAIGSRCGQIA